MLVRDWKNSEVGRQRRRSSNGRLLHCCCVCGKLDTWGEGWCYFGSLKQLDDGDPVAKFCSDDCSLTGGPAARDITRKQIETAHDAEWREPDIAYREATEKEKFRVALDRQRKPPQEL